LPVGLRTFHLLRVFARIVAPVGIVLQTGLGGWQMAFWCSFGWSNIRLRWGGCA
jgi:hypothetical protein